MSLQDAAKHLSMHGRGPDDHLVHMSGKEVQSLQKLAQAHGGSLTTNPHTGLPEAGFLDSLLPTIIGAGVGVATGDPMLGAAASGMFGFAKSGSLTQGLMAGLAGYGGAGLTAGITPDQVENMFTSGSATGGAGAASNIAPTSFANAPTDMTAYAPTPTQFGAFGEAPSAVGTVDPTAVSYNSSAFTGDAPTTGTAAVSDSAQQATSQAMGNGAINPTPSISDTITNNFKNNKMLGAYAAAPLVASMAKPATLSGLQAPDQSMIAPRYRYTPGMANPTPAASPQGKENTYFPGQGYTQLSAADAKSLYGYADGGMTYGAGMQDPNMQTVPSYDPVVRMASGGTRYDPNTQTYSTDPTAPANSISSTLAPSMYDPNNTQGGNSNATTSTATNGSPTGSTVGDIGYSLSALAPFSVIGMVAQSMMDSMSPTSVTSSNAVNGMDSQSDAATAAGVAPAGSVNGGVSTAPGNDGVGAVNGVAGDTSSSDSAAHGGLMAAFANGGGAFNLGGYSDGGRLLRGPGDGVSDSIPATIGHKQPARLADGEFVVPARIVSELGNGSTEAGARKLYAMMDRVQKARGKTVGKNKVATNTRADKHLPA